MVSLIDSTSSQPIQPTARTSATANIGHPAQEQRQWQQQLEAGKPLHGKIMALLDDGTAIVKLSANNQSAATTVQMTLPSSYQVGDDLQLNWIMQGNGRPGLVLPNNAAAASQVQLSNTALLLDKISQQPSAPQITASSPLIGSGKPELTALADALQRSVNASGVFYESHLKDWHTGQRSLAQIQQEPQNQTDPNSTAVNPWLPAQLDSLEHQRFAWQGEIWPDQSMQWDITREQHQPDSHDHQATAEAIACWHSSLRLTMPNLGTITVRLQLQGDRVKLQFETEVAATASALTSASEHLQTALQQRGSHIDQFSVHNDVSA